MTAMIPYETLVQTIADWKAGARPAGLSVPPPVPGSPDVVEELESGIVDMGEGYEQEYAVEGEYAAEGEYAPGSGGEYTPGSGGGGGGEYTGGSSGEYAQDPASSGSYDEEY